MRHPKHRKARVPCILTLERQYHSNGRLWRSHQVSPKARKDRATPADVVRICVCISHLLSDCRCLGGGVTDIVLRVQGQRDGGGLARRWAGRGRDELCTFFLRLCLPSTFLSFLSSDLFHPRLPLCHCRNSVRKSCAILTPFVHRVSWKHFVRISIYSQHASDDLTSTSQGRIRIRHTLSSCAMSGKSRASCAPSPS